MIPAERIFVRKDETRVPVLVEAASFEDEPEEGVCFTLGDLRNGGHAQFKSSVALVKACHVVDAQESEAAVPRLGIKNPFLNSACISPRKCGVKRRRLPA
jgi:hypothetical protein